MPVGIIYFMMNTLSRYLDNSSVVALHCIAMGI